MTWPVAEKFDSSVGDKIAKYDKMNLIDLLNGKKMNYMTDAKVIVQLEIKTVKEISHRRDLEPATSANDWWPDSEEWKTFEIEFTNGFVKTFRSLAEIDIVP